MDDAHSDDLTPAPTGGLPHVVIVGAGFGGLACAQALGRHPVRVTVVDRHNYHLFVPLLYQVATAGLSPADIAEPIRKVLRRHPRIDVVMGEVIGVDLSGRRVLLAGSGHIAYDQLVLATGSAYTYFGHDDWAAHAPGLKSIADARAIRARVLRGFEQAEISRDADEQRRLTTTVIVGGGPTGVEMAGAIAELANWSLQRDFRNIDPRTATVLLIEAGPRILPAFPEPLADYSRRKLEKLGVTVRTGAPVEEVREDGVVIAGRLCPANVIVWGAGIKASPAAAWIGVPPDRLGRIAVEADLSVAGIERVYAIGDTALSLDESGQPLPALAQVAKQQGLHLGRHLPLLVGDGKAIPPFRFRNRGNTAVVGRSSAIFDFGGGRQMKGWLAWILWALIHVYLLVSFEKRLLVSAQWLWRWATYQRGARLITWDTPSDSDPRAAPSSQPGSEPKIPDHRRI
ncbi:NAD(P)/FAD-dependent oxidoreductase [Sphingosinicella sp. CPCC 101087]|uniref:NAD(P)/FAD-dependent oxidoreductase n=1 Tax=Sphingosinicella sp. CPCC 101087 TaxID=2497754 RepID=UPI00101D93A0|nr:NAD(P)/FAD-dependent oxidoreductase [Sphingosinicella sp. CPCC 101087]